MGLLQKNGGKVIQKNNLKHVVLSFYENARYCMTVLFSNTEDSENFFCDETCGIDSVLFMQYDNITFSASLLTLSSAIVIIRF
jgi:hypothetical protein